jgi:hypothetical protein
MEVDGEKEELSSEVKQKQLVCYFTVLGQAWPEIQSTQGMSSFTISHIISFEIH